MDYFYMIWTSVKKQLMKEQSKTFSKINPIHAWCWKMVKRNLKILQCEHHKTLKYFAIF